MKGVKLVSVGMELLSGEVESIPVIPELESGKGQKYLGILKASGITDTEKNDKNREDYYSWVRHNQN